MDAHEYLLKHSQELSEESPGKYLAIVEKIVIILLYIQGKKFYLS